MQRLLIILQLLALTAQSQNDSLREFIPLLPKESELCFSEWKISPHQAWIRGTTKGRLPVSENCKEKVLSDWNIQIGYDLYNLFNAQSKANLSVERNYINDVYNNLKAELEEFIRTEKNNGRFDDFSKVAEEKVGEGKAFYFQCVEKCSGGQTGYVFYTAYIPFKPGFLQIDIQFAGSVERAGSYAKEIIANMKTLESYDFFAAR